MTATCISRVSSNRPRQFRSGRTWSRGKSARKWAGHLRTMNGAELQGAYDRLRYVGVCRPRIRVVHPSPTGVTGLVIGRAAPQMVVDEANPRGWSVRRVLPISLTYDHR